MSRTVSSLVTPKKNLQGTLLLFTSIVVGIFIFMVLAFIIGQNKGPLVPHLVKYHTAFTVGMAALSFGCLIIAKRIFNSAMIAAKNSLNPLTDKLNQHRSALVKYLVICEVPVMLSIILFLLTGNFVFQVYAGVFIGFMLSVAPIRRRVVAELELDAAQQKELE